MEPQFPLHTGLRERRRNAVAVEIQLLADLDRTFPRHDLDQHHQAAKAVVTSVHPLSDADDLGRVFKAAEFAQTEGTAILECWTTLRVGLIVVRACDIVILPSRYRDFAAGAKRQIIAVNCF